MTESQSLALILKIKLSRMMPALLTNTVIGPSSAAVCCTAFGSPFVGDIRANGDSTATIFNDLLDSARAALLIKIHNTDRHAVGGESMGDSGTNAARRAGDDSNSHGGDPT